MLIYTHKFWVKSKIRCWFFCFHDNLAFVLTKRVQLVHVEFKPHTILQRWSKKQYSNENYFQCGSRDPACIDKQTCAVWEVRWRQKKYGKDEICTSVFESVKITRLVIGNELMSLSVTYSPSVRITSVSSM